ncbi:hypothetical protein GS399_06000 [Pedobacter sp. HMF7647]|uniref:6-bladed beta-propeller n=1 Tax=Hufsiella arboris TaxID=2695275 RepID=A0A7K1Y8W8_9SPHI|nr:hypothetical protein [Hufsiella arboris]MXV50519.1 hypothetical protein [Hufsiella arboris]
MKSNACKWMLFSVLIIAAACKKSEIDNSGLISANGQAEMSTSAQGVVLPLTVKTIAGNAHDSGYQDGPGPLARFDYPEGIDVLNDGTIYITDRYDDKIRKISPDNVVSTIPVPLSSDGQSLNGPVKVRVQKNGTINILTYDADFVVQHKVWILKPNGQVITPDYKSGPVPVGHQSYIYNDLQKDPYSDDLFIGGLYRGPNNSYGVIEKFEVKDGKIGTNAYLPPLDSLNGSSRNNPEITSFFCGYNKVKYIVVNGNSIYKSTSSGVFTQIYRNMKFTRITSIVANRDSRSIYIADNGTIKTIANNKLQYLAGPHYPHDRHNGVGSSADVYAVQIGLSKDESTIYFTDLHTVRKIILRP